MVDRLKMIKLSKGITPDDIRMYEKSSLINKFLEARSNNPSLTKREICNKINVSERALDRTRKDLELPSFYRYDIAISRSGGKKVPKRVE